MRTIMVILLLAVCFLLGIIYANGQPADLDRSTNEITTSQQLEQVDDNHDDEVPPVNNENLSSETAAINETPHTFQKVASTLEGVVSGFYNMVVDMMYAFSEMFF